MSHKKLLQISYIFRNHRFRIVTRLDSARNNNTFTVLEPFTLLVPITHHDTSDESNLVITGLKRNRRIA